ncbi:MAG: hypothetical protein PHV66_08190 [Bacteroidales bacterium]|nr:hypothetical protein [Bacteroidales bacterium]
MDEKIKFLFEHLRDEAFDFNKALTEVNKELADFQNNGDEQRANQLWAVKTVIDIHHGVVEVFCLLKDMDYYKAWCKAEEVEIMCNNLKRNFSRVFPFVNDLYECIQRLQILYPYRIFSSYVIKIKKERCSICGHLRSLRNDCGHRKCYVYNGEFCCNIVEESELIGIDIVDNPVHKYAVLFATDKNGSRVDNYDYLLLEGLMQYWQKPFQHWKYDIHRIHKPVSDFPGLTDSNICPCASGKKYSDCCKSDPEGIEHKVYQFMVEKIG